jgi:hypothetical protein
MGERTEVLLGLPIQAVWFAKVGTPLPQSTADGLDEGFHWAPPEPPVEDVRASLDVRRPEQGGSVLESAMAVVIDFGAGTECDVRVALPEIRIRSGSEQFKVLFMLSEELSRRGLPQ